MQWAKLNSGAYKAHRRKHYITHAEEIKAKARAWARTEAGRDSAKKRRATKRRKEWTRAWQRTRAGMEWRDRANLKLPKRMPEVLVIVRGLCRDMRKGNKNGGRNKER